MIFTHICAGYIQSESVEYENWGAEIERKKFPPRRAAVGKTKPENESENKTNDVK